MGAGAISRGPSSERNPGFSKEEFDKVQSLWAVHLIKFTKSGRLNKQDMEALRAQPELSNQIEDLDVDLDVLFYSVDFLYGDTTELVFQDFVELLWQLRGMVCTKNLLGTIVNLEKKLADIDRKLKPLQGAKPRSDAPASSSLGTDLENIDEKTKSSQEAQPSSVETPTVKDFIGFRNSVIEQNASINRKLDSIETMLTQLSREKPNVADETEEQPRTFALKLTPRVTKASDETGHGVSPPAPDKRHIQDLCMQDIRALELNLARSVGTNYAADNRMVARVNEGISAEFPALIPKTEKVGEEVLKGLGQGPLPRVSFSEWTTTRAAQYFIEERQYRVSLLNFASGFNPGGGYLKGNRTQEEDLCRMMPFYHPSLMAAKDNGYYPFGPAEKPGDTEKGFSGAGRPTVLVTPDLSIWRTDNNFFRRKGSPLYIDKAVAVASPCLARRALSPTRDYPWADVGIGYFAPDHMEKMLDVIFAAGVHKESTVGNQVLVTGALGCGDFGNDPWFMASALVRAIHRYGYLYNEVHVPLPIFNERDKQNGDVFYEIIRDAFPYISLPRGVSLSLPEPSERLDHNTVAIIPISLCLTEGPGPYTEAFLKEKTERPYLLLADREHWQQLQGWNCENCSRFYGKEFKSTWTAVQWRRGRV